MLKKIPSSLIILIFLYLIASLVTTTSAYTIYPDPQYRYWSEDYLNISRGQGQSFFVENPGLISEFQMYFDFGIDRNFSNDVIICNLRDSQGKILQNSSIHGFYLFDYGYKTFLFNKTLSKGSYIITCYLNSPYPDENHKYLIKCSHHDYAYVKGSRYISFGNDFKNLNTWKITHGDTLFKVIINEEKAIKTPDKSHALPPNVPEKPSGPSLGLIGVEYSFSTSAIDPNNDKIMYIFDWGDGTSSDSKYYDSSFSASEKHSWDFTGNYDIKIIATNSNGSISSWSEISRITIESPDNELIEKVVEKRYREKLLVESKQVILYVGFIIVLYSILKYFGLISLLNNILICKYPNIDIDKLYNYITLGTCIGIILNGVFAVFMEYDNAITLAISTIIGLFFVFGIKWRKEKTNSQ